MQVTPFTIIIDTREQAPFRFNDLYSPRKDKDGNLIPLVVQQELAGLKTGDYTIAGLEGQTAVERKSLSDFLHCCGNDRERFEGGQLARLHGLKVAAVVVEASWPAILSGGGRSEINRKAVFRSVLAWQIRMPNIHWHFCYSRRFAEIVTFRFLERFYIETQTNKPA